MESKSKVLNKIFKDLRKRGLWAKRGLCCQTCTLDIIPNGVEHYAFYHTQDFTALKRYGEMRIAFGEYEDADAICEIATNHGVTAFWDGNVNHRVLLNFNDAPGTIDYIPVESFAVPLTSML